MSVGNPGFDRDDAAGYRLDAALRSRLADVIEMFLFSFDQLLAGRTAENIQNLQKTTDQLLRAAARVRLVLELAARRERQ
jgi:hypothetical protein